MLNCQIEQNPMTNMMMVKPCSSWKSKFLFIFLSLMFLMSFSNSALTVVNISTNNHSNEQIVTSTSVYSIVPITTVVNISEISSSSKRHRRYLHHQLKDSLFSSSNYFDSLPSLTSPLDFHWTNHLYYNNDDDYDYETNNNDGPEFSGPIFIVEPNIASSSERYYDNQTLRLTLTCKAQGYPIPKIYWRIDNMTIMNHHMNQQDMNTAMMMESETGYSWDTPQYWPHLNAMITLRNDGQTLIIGGTPMNNGNGNINQHHHQHLYQTGSNYIHHSSLQQPYMTISHQVECLAINRFGSIISKPIIVSQRQQVTTNGLNRSSSSQSSLANSFLKPIGQHLGPNNGKSFNHNKNNIASGHEMNLASNQENFITSSSTITSQTELLNTIDQIQLYDEFVSRGNVAVLKCLVVVNTVNGVSHLMMMPGNSNNGGSNTPVTSSSGTSSSSSSSSTSGSTSSSSFYYHPNHPNSYQYSQLLLNVIFEWRIKNGPAASPLPPIDPIIMIRSNQTQGKYTAYPSGELHVRDVDEHDSRRTYQCAVYHAQNQPKKSQQRFTDIHVHHHSNQFIQQQQQQHQQPSSQQQTSQQMPINLQRPLAESTFAQIILSGGEKDIFPPRIVHRLDELDADDGQLEPLLIPCAAHSQPLSSYKWYWIPFGVHFDWETEIATLLLSQQQQQKSSSTTSSINSFAMPIPVQQSNDQSSSKSSNTIGGQNVDPNSKEYRRQQLMLSRLRSMDSTLLIPGPITHSNAGHYIAIVANTVGYDRCITTVNVRSPLTLKIDSVPIQAVSTKKLFMVPTHNARQQHQFHQESKQQKIIRGVRGEIIRIRCTVHGFPLSDVYWLHNTQMILVNSGQNVRNGNEQKQEQNLQPAVNYHYHYGVVDLDSLSSSGYYPGSGNSRMKMNTAQYLQLYGTDINKDQTNSNNRRDISAIQHLDLVLDDRSKSGMYQCFARNRFETVQATIQIQVMDQPPSIVEHFNELTVQSGESFTLRCVSRGSPLAQIEWTLDRMPMPTSNRFRLGDFVMKDNYSHHGSSTFDSLLVSHLNVTGSRVEDGGVYRCTAKNLAGSTYYEARINVLGKGAVKVHTPNLTVLSGTDINLNCPFYGYPIKTISWFGKDGSQRKLPTNGRQHISPNGTLHISKINKKEDEGAYECEVEFSSNPGSTSQTKLHLNVITGPRIDNFTFAPNLEEGMRSVVVCAVISGDPPILIHWLKDGQPLTSSGDRKIEMVNEFTSSITFTALKRRHVGRYTCIASNMATSDRHHADLRVNVAPVWLFEPEDIIAISGQMLVIDCQAEGIPEPQVRWKVEGNDLLVNNNNAKKLPTKSISESSNSNSDSNSFHAVISNPHMQILENGSLIIKEVNRDDHRRYMCSAFNGVGSGISTIIKLSVHFPPQFVHGFWESKQAKLGEIVTLTCLVKLEYIDNVQALKFSNLSETNIDELLNIRWFKDTSSTPVMNSSHSKLSVTDLSYDRYHITQTFEVNQDGLTGSTLNLTKQADTFSINQSNQKQTNPNVRYYATKLTIRHTDRSDTGVYLCTAQNLYGAIRKNFTVTVLEQPDRPEDIRADEVASQSIKLTWPLPFDGNSPINEYVISYRTIIGSISNTVTLAPYAAYLSSSMAATTTDPHKKFISFQLSDLTPATAYIIQIKAKNSIGSSPFSDSITVKTTEEPPNDVPTDITILPLNTRSLKISWRPPRKPQTSSSNHKSQNNVYIPPITGYYIGYRPHLDIMDNNHQNPLNEFVFKTIKSGIDLSSSDTHESFILNNLKRATRYDIKIQAFNLAGAGPSSSEYQGKTLEYDVPSAPRIRALKSNLSSIELMWSVQGEEPIHGFVISYKPATQTELKLSVANVAEKISSTVDDHINDWKTIKIELELLNDANLIDTNVFTHSESAPVISTFQRRTYVLGSLRCGTKYFIYVNAYNGAGQGDPSEVILARTEGNVPVPPESVQDFVKPNISNARINLNQWKRLGCPIEKFELDFRVFGNLATNRKLTLTPSTLMDQQSNLIEVESDTHTNLTAQLVIELTNLLPGSWYELLIQAFTEAGTVNREYIFSTQKSDGSTIAPLTLKAIEEFHDRTNGQQQGRQSSSSTRSQILTNSFRSSMFAQLHYIVPVSCTLVILFLVFVVVCAIQTNRQNFLMFSLVANTRQRHHKVASGSKLSSQYSTGDEGAGQLGNCLESNDGSIVAETGEHIYGSNPVSMANGNASKMQCSASIDELLDGSGKSTSKYSLHNDSCHSLVIGDPGLNKCDHKQQKVPDVKQQHSQYPLYSLPVAYATSSVQFQNATNCNVSVGPNTTVSATTSNSAVRLIGSRKSQDDPLYGTLSHHQQHQTTFTAPKNQFTEMYCDGPQQQAPLPSSILATKFPFTLTESVEQHRHHHHQPLWPNTSVATDCINQSIPTTSKLPQTSTKSVHPYELPFVFKSTPSNGSLGNHNNESTAF